MEKTLLLRLVSRLQIHLLQRATILQRFPWQDGWLMDIWSAIWTKCRFPQALSNLPSSRVVLNANQTTHPIGGEVPLQINSICSPGIDIFSFTKFLISATVSCRTSWRWCLDGRLWNAQRLGMWRRWYIYIYNDHFKDRERGLCPSLTSMKRLPAAIKYLFHLLQIYIPFHEVLGPSTNGKPM